MKTAHKLLIAFSIFMVAMTYSIQSKAQSNCYLSADVVILKHDSVQVPQRTNVTFKINNILDPFTQGIQWKVIHKTDTLISSVRSGNKDTCTFALKYDYNKPVYIEIHDTTLGSVCQYTWSQIDTVILCIGEPKFNLPTTSINEGDTIKFSDTLSKDNRWGNFQQLSYTWNFSGNTDSTYISPQVSSDTSVNITLTSNFYGGSVIGSQTCSITKTLRVKNVLDTILISVSPLTNINAKIFVSDKQLTINSETNIRQVQVFNLTGQLIKAFASDSDRNTFSLQELSNGIYIVSVMDANDAILNKRIIVM